VSDKLKVKITRTIDVEQEIEVDISEEIFEHLDAIDWDDESVDAITDAIWPQLTVTLLTRMLSKLIKAGELIPYLSADNPETGEAERSSILSRLSFDEEGGFIMSAPGHTLTFQLVRKDQPYLIDKLPPIDGLSKDELYRRDIAAMHARMTSEISRIRWALRRVKDEEDKRRIERAVNRAVDSIRAFEGTLVDATSHTMDTEQDDTA